MVTLCLVYIDRHFLKENLPTNIYDDLKDRSLMLRTGGLQNGRGEGARVSLPLQKGVGAPKVLAMLSCGVCAHSFQPSKVKGAQNMFPCNDGGGLKKSLDRLFSHFVAPPPPPLHP